MRGGETFFDTNVVLYLLSEDMAKADLAEELLASGGVISVREESYVDAARAGIEDLVLFKQDGVEVLTHADKHLEY